MKPRDSTSARVETIAHLERFSRKFTIDPSGCWLWKKPDSRGGYGVYTSPVTKASNRPHRYMYDLIHGPIASGLVIDHLCRNRACVNPNHLEAVTTRTNIMRGVGIHALNAAKTSCHRGHPFDVPNTYFRPSGGRECRACKINWQRAHAKKVRELREA